MNEIELTPGAGAELLLKAETARLELAATQSYLQRGRGFKDLSDADLRERWADAFREWSRAPMCGRPQACDDAEAELQLRGQPVPYDMVPDAMEALRTVADAVHARMRPEDITKMGEVLVSRYVEEREQEN